MKISVKGRYGLCAMIYLGMNQPNKISSTIISEKLGLSKIYLEQVMSVLKKSGLVDSEKGANGGYSLAKPLNQITSYDILYAFETNLFEISKPISSISHIEAAIDEVLLQKIDSLLINHLSNISLETLVNQSIKIHKEINMYYI